MSFKLGQRVRIKKCENKSNRFAGSDWKNVEGLVGTIAVTNSGNSMGLSIGIDFGIEVAPSGITFHNLFDEPFEHRLPKYTGYYVHPDWIEPAIDFIIKRRK